ncbi:uncharacterized protein [Apostichopus japonicus]|uniref:uncharacterized protein isoform X2 n=1 Tax=Stichopus japonicus TaxID=307972 RepID=UPI003AB452D1
MLILILQRVHGFVLYRARDEKTLPADPSLDDVSAEPQLRAHAYWMLGVIKFSEGRRPTKFPPEGGQSLLDTGCDHIFRGKKANLRQVSTRGVWIHGLFELTSNPAASIFLAMDSSGPLFVMFVALWSLY